MKDEVRRPSPGFISDAEDILHDIEEIDRRNEGILTPAKIASIKRYVKRGGELASPEWLAINFKVSVEDVNRVIDEMK
ncbi:hypothetical protein [Rhizobium sp. MHM7A]|uniref:hypothetical protein n=1 Tax=Rhizobium sp. MHM7A TaxID=2583233 RepID=UPI0011074D11|nr:hypothetical protein [Rhizobium sp. MHM7A]TLX16694.1 hypothetical protein FFR93_04955 [Rhizobium sp. MHM7A]